MKKLFLKTLLCSICITLLGRTKTHAQNMVNGKEVDTTFNTNMNQVFGKLDKTKIPFGLLRDYAMEFTNLENFNGTALVDSNQIDRSIFWQICTTLATARMNGAFGQTG
jgi:hypothetical protein